MYARLALNKVSASNRNTVGMDDQSYANEPLCLASPIQPYYTNSLNDPGVILDHAQYLHDSLPLSIPKTPLYPLSRQ